jgi:hypothetical protein
LLVITFLVVLFSYLVYFILYIPFLHPGNGPSQYAPCESNIHILKPNSILFENEIRKLVNESNGTFLKARSIGKKADLKNAVLKYSREHRYFSYN